VDNDDGTAYYNTSRNLMMYGGAGMKSDCTSKHRALFDAPKSSANHRHPPTVGGHDNVHHDNVVGFMSSGFGICPQLKGHPDQ
jgi:hypothetical protein